MEKYKDLFSYFAQTSIEKEEKEGTSEFSKEIDEIWNKVKNEEINLKTFGEGINITKNKLVNGVLLGVALAIFLVFLYGVHMVSKSPEIKMKKKKKK